MEAVPRLPMISFELRVSPENAQFGPQLKQYIANFYNEDPESYNAEISNLETLRAAAIRPTIDVAGCQLLKKYYCQLHFLKSRFPMAEMQAAAVYFSWKDNYSSMPCSVADIRFELMNVLHNIGALHTQLGESDSRTSPDGLKMACTHFQCAAWAFQTIKETYYQMVGYFSTVELVHLMQQVCFAQAQECILEKSMMDNRKATITAKVAVQVVDHYRRALALIQAGDEDTSVGSFIGGRTAKEWTRYLSFKVSYHKCIALLFQGQQAEEQQKMGERVAFYQAACEQLEEARKLASNLKQQKDLNEAIAFTSDVVEGKRKAAKNENEFIYHEEVPERNALQEVKGASLVKGIAFNVNDIEVSGPDIFARLVPMEAHEASSLYSEKKAQKLRQLGELVEAKDQALAEFMSSLQLDVFSQMRQATGLSQELVDRAAALSAKPKVTQELVAAMGKLSNSYHEVEAMLNEIQELLKEEEQSEKEYQELMGKRPPSIIATDLAREAAKYREAHNKANDSNQNLHKAMTTHVANLKILSQPLMELQKQIPAVEFPNPNIDEGSVREIENLVAKVEEMRNQRAMLWTQFREAVHQDDITNVLVTRQADQPLDQLFQQELQKHQELTSLIEQNVAAQENILKAFVEAYARSTSTRRYLQDIINKRNATVSALVTSYDNYEDLLAKANKGFDFYSKLETNVSKLLQRIKSASKVQQEEREQMLLKNSVPISSVKDEFIMPPATNTAPKLKDYIDTRKKTTRPSQYYPDQQVWPPAVRPAPLGSEVDDPIVTQPQEQNLDQNLSDRMAGLRTFAQNYSVANYNNYIQPTGSLSQTNNSNKQEATLTTDTYQPISSITPDNQNEINTNNFYAGGQHPSYSMNYTAPTSTSLDNYNQANQPNAYYGTAACGGQIYNYPMGQVSNEQSYKYHMGFSSGQNNNQSQNASQQSYSYPISYSSADYNQAHSSYIPPTNSYMGTDYNACNYMAYTSQANASSTSYIPPTSTYVGTNYSTQAQTNVSGANYQTPISSYVGTNYSTQAQAQTNISSNSYQTPISSYVGTGIDYSAPDKPSVPGANYAAQVQPSDSTTNYSVPTVPNTNQAYQNYDPNQQYQYYYGANYPMNQPYQNYDSGYSYISQPQTNPAAPVTKKEESTYGYVPQQLSETAIPVTTKESNIDLLTGLDFNVNQAPLIPQQKTSTTEVKPESPKPVKVTASKEKEEVVPLVPKIEKVINRKPLNNAELKKLFELEVDKFEKFVDVLPNKTLSGPTNLDLKWKEIQDKQEAEKKVISVARCYPMKNRYPDILPYDYSRVELQAAKDDYINASYVKDISYYAAPFIVTQAPVHSTISDFWTMIKEQQIELIVCLLGDNEIGNDVYWPLEKGRDLTTGGMVISLVGITVKPHWIERLISLSIPEKRDSRVLIHLQFTSWPGSLFPTNPEPFATYITEIINLFLQQRNPGHPVVVHCLSGIGRSGLVCLLVTAILEVTSNPVAISDLVSLTCKLAAWRKNILRDREHLKFAYEVYLAYMKQVVAQGHARKILNEVVRNVQESHSTAPVEAKIDDPLSSLDPFWASKKGT